jgi:sigma-B regulation protein RsbU (phosphoserine phosphatase)
VRAGHDPGLMYRPGEDRFDALDGPGMALGVDPDGTYAVQKQDGMQAGDIVLVGTDGIWEARNCDGGMFGKSRFEAVVRTHRDQSAEAILEAVFDAVHTHACDTRLADDMTLIVVKITARDGE